MSILTIGEMGVANMVTSMMLLIISIEVPAKASKSQIKAHENFDLQAEAPMGHFSQIGPDFL